MLDRLLFITRKFPPQVGGMENLCFYVYEGLLKRVKKLQLIALGKTQKHLIWFYPYALIRALISAHKYQAVLFGDGVLCSIGYFIKRFSPKTSSVIIIHGLDILFDNFIYQTYLKLFLKNSADLFICDSTETELVLHKRGIMNTAVVTPGVDVTAFERKNATPKEQKYEKLVLLTVGRLVKRKGVNWFVRNVMPQFKGLPITYYVVGAGSDKEVIEQGVAEYGLEDQVHVLGRVSDERLAELYDEADIFIMPNIKVENDMEGFGIVAIEASLRGLLVLASGIEGIKDAVIDGKNGYILESANVKQFTDKVMDIYQNRESYAKKLAQFSNYTVENYSWETICDQHLAQINACVEKKHATGTYRA